VPLCPDSKPGFWTVRTELVWAADEERKEMDSAIMKSKLAREGIWIPDEVM
jgi:ABC-type proline/glycine betaine transport system substrate-binding protein